MIRRDDLERLAPLARSITGDGVRATLDIVRESLPIEVVEVPSGTPVLDWTIPDEWNLRRAWIADADGRVLVDTDESALHVVSYSEPVRLQMSFEELRPRLHTLPDRPAWIPYRTSYWNRTWGFCLAHDRLDALAAAPSPLEVVVDTTLQPGSLTYGELVVPGRGDRELLVSTHVCHPSMVNDNASGIAALAEIGRRLLDGPALQHRVRLLFVPGTIGSIAWLAQHLDVVARVDGGLVLTGLGDGAPLTYKSSRRGDTRIDRIARRVVTRRDPLARLLPWDPYGYDERQFCSPGFDLAVGRLTRGVHGTYPEYHTSADDLAFTSTERVDEAVEAVHEILRAVDGDDVLVSRQPHGEPQLGRRGLYRALAGMVDSKSTEVASLWVLSLADGQHGIDDVVERSGLAREIVEGAVERLDAAELVELMAPDAPNGVSVGP